MANSRKTSKVHRSIHQLGMPVGELFDDDQLADLMAAARRRIIAAFHHATEMHRGRRKGTDNYVRGVEPKMSELAYYVQRQMKHPFISEAQLPASVDRLSSLEIKIIIQQATYDIIMATLKVMCVPKPKTPSQYREASCSYEIYYDSELCVWQIVQSSIDEYVMYRRAARTAGQASIKDDRRNYHGRVRSQSRRRGIPEGVSVSLA